MPDHWLNGALNREARAENALTLAAALNVDPDLAAELLVAEVVVTVDEHDESATRLARDVVTLLRRTISHVSYAPASALPSVEVVIGAASPKTRGPVLRVGIERDRIVAGVMGAGAASAAAPATARSADVPSLFLRLGACYVAGLTLQMVLGEHAFATWPDPFVLSFAELGVTAQQCAEPLDLDHAYLAGAGAVGNGLIWAMETLDVRGTLTIADDDTVESGNLNRQILFDETDVTHSKADRLAARARELIPRLRFDPRPLRLQSLPECRQGAWLRRLIVAVDSRRARRALQSEMPGEVFDASTTDVREVVIHYNRQPTNVACMSCIYMRDAAEYTREAHIAEHLGVSVDEVRSERISADAAHRVARRFPLLVPAQIEGLAFDTLFKRLCAEAALTTPEGRRILAPFAFASCLAGTLLAIELLRRISTTIDLPDNYWRLSVWHPPMSRRRAQLPRQAECEFCGNPILRSVSDLMWTRSFNTAALLVDGNQTNTD